MQCNSARFLLMGLVLFYTVSGIAQTGGPIINITFGEGRTNPGLPLPSNKTNFHFTTDSCPARGSYTVTNSLYRCPSSRMGRSLDNTPGSNYGYMMLVNDTVSGDNKILYIDTLREILCAGTAYQFSAAILNTMIPGNCTAPNIHLPGFTLIVESTAGQLLQLIHTGPMNYDYDMIFTPKFHVYRANFTLPPGIQDLVLKIIDDAAANSPCGYSFAIDDIRFAAAGPEAKIAFSDAIGTELIRSVCFQDNKTISITATIADYYSNTALQWQQSTDNGTTWTDIPGAIALNYSRAFSAPDTFLYRLSAAEAININNPNCRVVSNSLKIEVDGLPGGYTISSNSPVCVGHDLKFNGTGAASYVWTGPNGFFDNISSPHIFFSSLADSGWYYVDVYSRGGCIKTDSTHATVIGTNVYARGDTSVCKGDYAKLEASPGVSYSWTPSSGLSATNVRTPRAKPDVTTVYIVEVTDNAGCSDTAHVEVRLLNSVQLKAMISGTDYLCRVYDSASFKDASTGNITSRTWNFGNGQTAITVQPPVQYYSIPANNNNYIVRLAIADTSGCTDTAYHLLKVLDNCYIAVPTAFTPNGDGLNDYLYPLNAYKATNLSFKVFNRNGQLVFESGDWSGKWDGTVKGIKQASGVYVWMLEYNDPSGKKISMKGTSVLIR